MGWQVYLMPRRTTPSFASLRCKRQRRRLDHQCRIFEEDSEWIVLDQNDWSNLASHNFDGCGAPVPGCTNENATNYNADANEDDGSACSTTRATWMAWRWSEQPSTCLRRLSVEPGTTVTWTNMGAPTT